MTNLTIAIGALALVTAPSIPTSPARTAPAIASPAATPAAAPKAPQDRYVKVSGLGRPSGGGKIGVFLLLAALIAGAAWFAVTRLL